MTKKILIAVVILAAIVIGGTGCAYRRYPVRSKSQVAIEEALKHLEMKYGEPFTYVTIDEGAPAGGREFLVSCDSLPEQHVWVQVEDVYSTDRKIRDNYLAVKYRDQTVAYLQETVSSAYPNVNVFYEVRNKALSETLPVNADFSEFLHNSGVELIAMLELKASEFAGTEQMDRIAEEIAEACPYMALTVIVIEDEVYGTLDRTGLNDCISAGKYVMRAKIYIQDGAVQVDWKGGQHE